MLSQKAESNIQSVLDQSEEERNRVRHLSAIGKWKEAEPDPARAARFRLKNIIKTKRNGAETQIGSLDWLDINFFIEGNLIQRAVGYVKVLADHVSKTGSGFMISPFLFMTNNHVISDQNEARGTTIVFNKQTDEFGASLPITEFRLDPDKFFITSKQEDFDFTIVALGPKIRGEFEISELGYFRLSDAPDKHVIGMNVNIIQHPLDLPKKVTFRNNLLTFRTDNSLLYESDTETCSSGSPVCNDDWDLIAIHHWGQPYLAKRENPDSELPEFVNEGIRISSIYKELSKQVDGLAGSQKDLLVEALSYAKTQPQVVKKVPGKRPISNDTEALKKELHKTKMDSDNQILKYDTMQNNNNELKLTIPIEVTIRVGNHSMAAPAAKKGANEITGADFFAEANKIDTDYSNRSGYDEDFIPGFKIPLPSVKKEADIAPLKNTESHPAKGILNYEHFAIIINKKRKCAFFSATNIDGETYKRVNRDTGEVTSRKDLNKEEGEVWYNDERIESEYHLNQDLFSNWSNFFDRGHLTRRTDPSWGTKKIALRADADTFHFTNCSMQHFRFNQTARYWQGVERYVLENGFLKADSKNRLIVFQGPVYDDRRDLWADDFQIPSKYFKIAIWNSKDKGLQAVGLMVDQSKLLSEERRFLGKPKSLPSVDVSQWRVRIKDIEEATGLDFGDVVKEADTIAEDTQPNVGEALVKIPITSWEDLL